MGNEIKAVGNEQYGNYLNSASLGGDSTFMGLGAIGQSSIFNSNPCTAAYNNGFYPTDFSSMGGMGMGMGMGMMGGTYNPNDPASVRKYLTNQQTMQDAQLKMQESSTASQIQSQQRLQDIQAKNQIESQHRNETLQFQAESADMQIKQDVANLANAVKENEQDNVAKEYGKLRSAVIAKLSEGNFSYDQVTGAKLQGAKQEIDSAKVDAYIQQVYKSETGSSLVDDLTKNGDSGFVHGLKNPFGMMSAIGLGDKTTTSDNIKNITGAEPPKAEGFWQGVGSVISGTVFCGGALTGIAGIFKALKHVKA